MKGKFLEKALLVLSLSICSIGAVELPSMKQANAAWEGSGYTVLQYEKHLKSFSNLDDAINYAKQWDHARVYGVSSGELYWDNYHVQVYQYNTYLGDFGSRLGAIAYAKEFDHTKVVDANNHNTVYWQWSYTINDFVDYLNKNKSSIDGIGVHFTITYPSKNQMPYIVGTFDQPYDGYSAYLDDEVNNMGVIADWGNSVIAEHKRLLPDQDFIIGIANYNGDIVLDVSTLLGNDIVDPK